MATTISGVIVSVEIVGGAGPYWAALASAQVANLAVAFGAPLVEVIGVVIAWLRQGTGETIGGAFVLVASLVSMVSALAGLGGGDLSMALRAVPIAFVGAAFMYCGWRSDRYYAHRAA